MPGIALSKGPSVWRGGFRLLLGGLLALSLVRSALAEPAVEIDRAWAKATPPTATVGAIYMTMRNGGDAPDRLVGADSNVSERAEVHLMKVEDGVASMQRLVDGVELPSGSEVRLEPGGLHLMLIGLTAPLVEGRTIVLRLDFERSGTVTVEVGVSSMSATGPQQ